jgi:hypothetical protein
MTAHLRGIGMRRIDDERDIVRVQIADQSRHAAESADAHFARQIGRHAREARDAVDVRFR